MKKSLFLLSLFSISLLSAQENSWFSPGMGVKLHSHFLADFEDKGIPGPSTLYRIKPLYPGFFFMSDKGHIHLIEISDMAYNASEFLQARGNRFHFSIAYEYSFPLLKTKHPNSWRPYLGIGLNQNLQRIKTRPNDFLLFRRVELNFKSNLYLQTSLMKSLGEKLFIDLAAQFYVGTFEGFRIKDEDPRIQFVPNFVEIRSTLPKIFGLRFGLGFRI